MDLTFRELSAFARGQARRETNAWRRAIWGAWHGAAFTRAKKMPRLETLMNRMRSTRRRPPAKTPEQLLAEFERFSAALGGAVLKRRPRLKAAFRTDHGKERE